MGADVQPLSFAAPYRCTPSVSDNAEIDDRTRSQLQPPLPKERSPFQNRFKSIVVEEEPYFLELISSQRPLGLLALLDKDLSSLFKVKTCTIILLLGGPVEKTKCQTI